MPKVYLIRNAETQATHEDPAFWPLSDRGEEQARMIARLPFWDAVTAIVSSDESSALATVSQIVFDRRLPLFHDVRLRELKRTSEHLEDPESRVLEVMQKPALSIGGWERATDAQTRATACFQELVDRYGEATFAVVSHGMTLALLLGVLQESVGYAFDIWQSLGHGSVVLVERDDAPALPAT
ncbi:MAG: histidine phosphatase family protein [Chloroflexi bacterium]|nr:histidine phosphatase family protein [Chloroflexota bacterium]